MVGPSDYQRTLYYSPVTSEAQWEDGSPFEFPNNLLGPEAEAYKDRAEWKNAHPLSPQNPGKKSQQIKILKIQLGLSCNYKCSYCNQTAQRSGVGIPSLETAKSFLSELPSWLQTSPDGQDIKFEFWGGEPLLYKKVLTFLGNQLRQLYPKSRMSMVTNGSLLNDELIQWIDSIGMSVAISHDGPAYEAGRGQDPLLSPKQNEMIRKLFHQLSSQGRIFFNCVLSGKGMSVSQVRSYLAHHLGVDPEQILLSTEGVVTPYGEAGKKAGTLSPKEQKDLTQTVFTEALFSPLSSNHSWSQFFREFLFSIRDKRHMKTQGQKCGMDRVDTLAVDLQGNALTCQNVAADKGHKIGHVSDFSQIRLNTSYHWSHRQECDKCPVLHLCKGSCMYIEGDDWKAACDNSFSYYSGLMAAALYLATGLTLTKIQGPNIRNQGMSEVEVISVQKNGLPIGYEGFAFPISIENSIPDLKEVRI